jgi:hypothetical protein
MSMNERLVALLPVPCTLMALTSCRCDDAPATDRPTTAAVASATASTPTPSASSAQAFPVPVGPGLAIIPGKGVGAIRFGANVGTIERLMELPCEVKKEDLCGYNGRAVDFHLQDGVVNEIHVHRTGRSNAALAGASYGVFNGALVSGPRLEMLTEAVIELQGPAERVEPISAANHWNTVEHHHYQGMTLQYDRLPNGNVVLGGVILRPVASMAAPAGSPGAPSTEQK